MRRKPTTRLKRRELKIWALDYLHYSYLWRNIQELIARALELVPCPQPTVLDVGCGWKPYRDLLPGCRYVGIDRDQRDSAADVLADAMMLPIGSGLVDIVLTTQTLEHVTAPHSMVREIARVLRPGGIVILTAPFCWPLHEEPHDFFRYTKYGLASLLESEGIGILEIRADGGDWAQTFLTVALRLSSPWWVPLRLLINVSGRSLDFAFHTERLPANYTVCAVRSSSGHCADTLRQQDSEEVESLTRVVPRSI